MAQRDLTRRLGKVRARARHGPLRPISVIQIRRSDVDPAWQDAAVEAVERASRAELDALEMPPGLLLTVGLDGDGIGVAEAGSWRWRVRVAQDGWGGAIAMVLAREELRWRH